MHAVVATAVSVLAAQDKPVDEDTNIVAGWTAFWVFLGLIAAVAVIGWALTRSLRTAARAKDAGVYGDEPVDDTDPDSSKDE